MPQHIGIVSAARTWKRLLLWAYLLSLVASHLFRLVQSPSPSRPDQIDLPLASISGDVTGPDTVRFSYVDSQTRIEPSLPVVILLHGSPAPSSFMMRLHRALVARQSMRIITPDLPGFGGSTRNIPDFSVAAHAKYLLQALDSLQISNAHIIAYSMSGGTALELVSSNPERVASLTMLSAIGVQELELTGDYYLNHALHALQLAALWIVEEGVPHFGWMDDALLAVPYARNFFDTDQRPLRNILKSYDGPMQIIHGTDDFLVRYDVAIEHHRLVPQSVLLPFQEGGHELVLTQPDSISALVDTFVGAVESGEATTRQSADPVRVQAAAQAFDPSQIPPASGFNLIVLFLLIVTATLVSEDLACIGAGLMVSRGTLAFSMGVSAAFAGIVVGDVLLYALGRTLGRSAVRHRPLRWFLNEAKLDRGTSWFRSKGYSVIIASRFVPGSRLPTYVAAGILKAPFWRFLLYFLAASVIWTPILVGVSALLGNEMLRYFSMYEAYAIWVLTALILGIFGFIHGVVPALSHRGRRMLRSRWMRLTRWEFWPPAIFYVPVLIYIAGLALKFRSLTVFTAANPGFPHGGFVGESKSDILEMLEAADAPVARFALIESGGDPLSSVRSFLYSHGLRYPVVLKPDVGERGRKVSIARSENDVRSYFDDARRLTERPGSYIVQEYVSGQEYGIFYTRIPSSPNGRIFSITDKRLLRVRGDGRRTIEDLILDDDRANCMAPTHLEANAHRLSEVPAQDEDVALVEVGTHCRGALFLDGSEFATDALRKALDDFSSRMDGFFFGRFDVRVPSAADLMAGHRFIIIELNGVTSEATDIYDPKNSLWRAYRVLFRQWNLAFVIGKENQQQGAKTTSVRQLGKLLITHMSE